jgi:hypothetical protein
MRGSFIRSSMLGLAVLALGCGGGGTGGNATSTQPSNSVTLSGVVSGSSGALTFAGQAMITSGATVTDQGDPATAASIKAGSIIQASATKTGQGYAIQMADLRHAVEGPIASIDQAGSKLVVLGQTVVVDALTVIEQEVPGGTATTLSLADLKVGDIVEVDGTANADGSIQATRIEREPAPPPPSLFVRGVVGHLDTTAMTFTIGGLAVSYGSALVSGTLADGVQVLARGSFSGSTLTATRVKVQVDLDLNGSSLEAFGQVSNLDTTSKTFQLLSLNVDYSQATVTGTLANGARVEVEGVLDTTGTAPVLKATTVRVAFTRCGTGTSNGVRIGVVTAVSATDLTLTLGTETFWTDSATIFQLGWTAATFGDVTVGSKVVLLIQSAKTNAAGQAYATKVEILPAPMTM